MLRPSIESPPIPADTSRVAQAIFPESNRLMRLRDVLGALFQTAYAARAGVEGTLSQGMRTFPLRQTRYIGLAKTHLQHILIAMAMHLARVAAWLVETPRAPTRLASFAALAGVCG